MWTFDYGFYLLFRAILGILASLVLSATAPGLSTPIWALLGVLGTVTILQNFTLNVGGADIANLAALRDRYKDRMIAGESKRRAFQENARSLRLQQRLGVVSASNLEMELRRMFLSNGVEPDATNQRIDELRHAAGQDGAYWQVVLSVNIVAINPDYAEQLVSGQTPRTLPPGNPSA